MYDIEKKGREEKKRRENSLESDSFYNIRIDLMSMVRKPPEDAYLRKGLPVSLEAVGCREKPLLRDDWCSTIGRSNKMKANLPGPTSFLGVSAPDDSMEGERIPAAAFRRGKVTPCRLWQKTGKSFQVRARLGTEEWSKQLEISRPPIDETYAGPNEIIKNHSIPSDYSLISLGTIIHIKKMSEVLINTSALGIWVLG